MKIFVYGWYNHSNLGDESYKLSFSNTWPEHEFTFSDTIKEDYADKFDLCIIGGGDVIRENSLRYISIFKCTKISISVTITSLSLIPEINILDHIYVRDILSYNKLLNYGYKNFTLITDISIILKGDKNRGKNLITQLFKNNKSEKYSKVYTININAHLIGKASTSSKDTNMFYKMLYETVELLDRTSASFLFLSFGTSLPWDDRVSNGLVNSYAKFYKKNCVIYDVLSLQDSLDIISASDLIITSRFHGLIFGLGNNIPTIPISFHDKMKGFCETINKKYINYWNFSSFELEKYISEVESEKIDTNKIKNDYRETIHFLQ